MQKKIIALAVAGLVSGVAFAQSNVTVYGVVDQNFAYSTGDNAAGQSVKFSGIQDGGSAGLNGSRVGFKGEEALGNGLKAIFTMEMGLNADNSPAATPGFSNVRQSFVGLNGGFGTVSLGRQYSPSGTMGIGDTSSNSVTSINPVNTYFMSFKTIDSAGGNSRFNNSVSYMSNNYSGFQGQVIYGAGEKVGGNQGAGDAGKWGIGANYTNGPLKVVALYQSIVKDQAVAGDDGVNGWFVGGAYDFKVVKAYANYTREKDKAAVTNDFKVTMWSLGLSVPVSTMGKFTAEYAQFKNDFVSDNESKGYSIGYIHDLSKRTALYTFLGQINNDSAANNSRLLGANNGAGKDNTSFAAGIRHFF